MEYETQSIGLCIDNIRKVQVSFHYFNTMSPYLLNTLKTIQIHKSSSIFDELKERRSFKKLEKKKVEDSTG